HLDVARAVQAGRADAGLGLPSGARSFGLEFVPLFEEPYDLACTREVYEDPRFTGFFASLNSSDFRARIRAWDGYSAASETGSAVLIH
ncbi:MAG TPA: substrate-binding domain-containing protein, partial [Anaerolineaceae bacterium]